MQGNPSQSGTVVTPQQANQQSGYYSRLNTMKRLIEEASVDEIVEAIRLGKISREIREILEKLPRFAE